MTYVEKAAYKQEEELLDNIEEVQNMPCCLSVYTFGPK
jgi:hypothetical protein